MFLIRLIAAILLCYLTHIDIHLPSIYALRLPPHHPKLKIHWLAAPIAVHKEVARVVNVVQLLLGEVFAEGEIAVGYLE